MRPIGFDLRGSQIVLGPSGSGRTTAVLTMAQAALRAQPGLRCWLFSPRRSVLTRATGVWTESAVGVDVTVAGLHVDVLLSPTTEFEEGFRVDWDFGDGLELGADDLDQHHDYWQPGHYTITAVVSQPSEASFALNTPVVVGDAA